MGLQLDPWLKQLTIADKKAQLRLLDPDWTPVQRRIVHEVESAYNEGRPCRLIICKSRQLGCSTISGGIGFSWATLFPNTSSFIVAHTSQSTFYLFDKTRLFYETWPLRSDYPTRYLSRRELAFSDNGSFIRVQTARQPDALRGRTIHFLHLSEVAFYEKQEETMLAARQAVPNRPGTVIICESTSCGLGNWFERAWHEAEAGENDFIPIFAPWFSHHEYIPCQGEHCRDGTCEVCLKTSRGLRPRDDEEKRLIGLGCDLAHIAWRRWALPNLAFNSDDWFYQEYPACVVGGTRVGTNLGILRIEETDEAEFGTFGSILKTHQQPESDVYRLKTKLGYELVGTWDHPIFTDKGLLVPLKASAGQKIKLQAPRFADDYYVERWWDAGIDHSVVINEEWGRFLGLFLADGSVSRSVRTKKWSDTISIACDAKDEDVIEEVVRLFKSLFGLNASVRQTGTKGGCREVRAGSTPVVNLLERLGVLRRRGSDNAPRRKVVVPECIWRSPKRVIKEFLRGWFEGDGFNGYGVPRVSLFCKEEETLKDLQILLLGFGVTCRRSNRVVTKGSEIKKYGYIERILTLRLEESLAFRREIGFISERKQSRSQEYESKWAHPNRQKLDSVDEVVTVEEAGRAVTYDFTIENGEAFDANGILTHNTAEESFLASGVSVFPEPWLKVIYEKQKPTIGRLTKDGFILDSHGPLRVYKPPSDDPHWGQYFLGADVAFGTVDGDYSVAQVINRQTKEQVATWHGRVGPYAFADELMKLGNWYNQAVISCEVNGPGRGTVGRLVGNYPRLWHRRVWPDRMPGHQRSDIMVGIETNWRVKQWLITQLADSVERGDITLHDRATYEEMKFYQFFGDRGDVYGPGGESSHGRQHYDPSKHDDLVQALAIAIVCERVESPVPPYEMRPGARSKDQKVIFGESVSMEELIGEEWSA